MGEVSQGVAKVAVPDDDTASGERGNNGPGGFGLVWVVLERLLDRYDMLSLAEMPYGVLPVAGSRCRPHQ